jgi:nucleotide-binding universal stress UspA family protein
MTFKRILCAVDLSQPSIAAFETAVELARPFKAALHVIHVIEADPAVPDLKLHEKALIAMNALISPVLEASPDLQLTSEITTGNPAVETLRCARQRNAQLIVMGAKGLRLPEEAVFGGTAKQVISDASCSVLVVRAGV